MANASFIMNAVEVFSENNQTVTAKNINVAANDLTTPSMAKAWVNFNGTLSMTVGSSYGPNVGNVNPIRAAYNVDYIIDRGTGDYEVHFENAMADANYCKTFGGMQKAGVGNNGTIGVYQSFGDPTAAQLRILCTVGNSAQDFEYVDVAIFR